MVNFVKLAKKMPNQNGAYFKYVEVILETEGSIWKTYKRTLFLL